MGWSGAYGLSFHGPFSNEWCEATGMEHFSPRSATAAHARVIQKGRKGNSVGLRFGVLFQRLIEM
jgi:hypothetical protein